MLHALLVAVTVGLSSAAIADPATAAQTQFTSLQHGAIDRSSYSQRMNAALTDAQVAQLSAQLTKLGDLRRMGLNASKKVDGIQTYAYVMVCANGIVGMQLSFDPNGLIDAIYFEPWGDRGYPWVAGGTYDISPPIEPSGAAALVGR